MLEIDSIGKENLYKIMFHQSYIINLLWFEVEDLIRTNYPEVLNSEEYMEIIERFGFEVSKGLAKALGITGSDIDSLIQVLRCSHWALFEDFKVEKLTDKSCRMRIFECSTQRAAKKWGMKHYECAMPTVACLRGYCNAVNPEKIIQKIFAPPEVNPKENPENVSCEWEISIKI